MSTRGTIGFILDGKEKIVYNHCDSYPDGLGIDLLHDLRSIYDLKGAIQLLRVVDDKTPPSTIDKIMLAKYADPIVSSGSLDEWYVLLRETQGSLLKMIDAGVIEDGSPFGSQEYNYKD